MIGPQGNLATYVADYREALASLAAWDVRVTNNRLSRYLHRMEEALQRELEAPDAEHPHQSDALFKNALLESHEFIGISHLDPALLVDPAVRVKLRMLGDGPEVMNSQTRDPARDYALEFGVAAQAAREGQLISMSAGDVEVGPPACVLECKRISSLKRLGEALSKGRQQIAAASRDGIIVMDLSTAIRAERALLSFSPSEAAQRRYASQELTAYLARHLFRHLARARQAQVLGLVMRHRVIGNVGSADVIRVAYSWQLCEVHPPESPQSQALDAATRWASSAPILRGTGEELNAAERAIFGAPRATR